MLIAPNVYLTVCNKKGKKLTFLEVVLYLFLPLTSFISQSALIFLFLSWGEKTNLNTSTHLS